MITPLDIQNKEFKRAFRGFKESEVDEFLDEIINDYEKVYKENIELKDKILLLNEQIEKYNNLEDTLKETLIVAQSTADEVIGSAKEKADLIVEDANLQYKKLIEEANNEVREVQKEYERLVKEMFIFKTRYRSFIEAQLETLDEFYSKIEDSDVSIDTESNNELELQDNEIEEDIDDLGA
ncbi:DivIVA domain-containing protein [Schnuerera sp. xch1]|uniref:DivIVA domain-containing protein n=1 Tax=Schnuerera sp. xch1 TaxID=2874283 RepID=UPI001CBE0879|nr:DivIVA domain-containing protein [Schnuerera sp. xch1]MBZ2173943.1 DivIVA domain-containing protein [Schnuerera sp. xch1]